ncbi:MAG: ABC transporter substrate-binding protein, partial [Chloroflexota bacterium]|nr:ABC transporter substrate-binding protein [Chloroflexota bacterium]
MIELNRRTLLQGAGLGLAGLSLPRLTTLAQDADMLDEVVIDLSTEPASLAPAQIYEPNGWSVAHAIFDAPFDYDASGNPVMVAAESMRWVDDLTLEIRMQSSLTFHDGTSLSSQSLVASYNTIIAPETGSSIAGNFATIAGIEAVDEITARITVSQPSPWLPAQIATWMLCIHPDSTSAAEVSAAPVGTGPYQFVEWVPGERIVLTANPNYNVPNKGKPIARQVTYRFVTESSTRVSDLQSGTAHIVRSVPQDQVQSVQDAGHEVRAVPQSSVAFVRIATDVAPFDDVRVRQALNYAVDVDEIRLALLGGAGERLPNVFVPNGMGYSEELEPYPYDPDRARDLLNEAGVSDLSTTLAVTNSERLDLVEAIAAYLGDVGINVTVEQQEIAVFNAGWTDPAAPPLRFASWRPMFDPFNLLNLVFSSNGFLSRHNNPNVQTLIDAAAVATDPVERESLYRQLGQVMFDEPAALYLWNVTAL